MANSLAQDLMSLSGALRVGEGQWCTYHQAHHSEFEFYFKDKEKGRLQSYCKEANAILRKKSRARAKA